MKTSFKESFVMSAGTIINSLLGLIFYIFIARFLGPSDFGNFSFLLGFGLLAAEVGDFGLGSALVRFGSGAELRGVFTITFIQRIILFLIFFLVSFMLGNNLYLSALVATSLQLLSLITQTFLARQKYVFFVMTNIFGNLCRLGLVLVLMSQLKIENTLLIFSGANFLAFSLGLILLIVYFKKNIFSLKEAGEMFVPVWNFSRWVALSFGISSFGSKIDIPIIYALAGSSATGIYSSAQKLISIFSQIASSIEGVFAPKFSAETKTTIKDYVVITILVSIGLLVLPLFSGFFISLIFGSKYFSATGVFNLMSLALIPFFLTGPFSSLVLYRFGKSGYHLAISAGQLVVGLVGYFLFIPVLGISGAVITTLLINVFGFLVYIKLYQKLK